MQYFIAPSLHNNMVQIFYCATNNLATCFDPTGPSPVYKIMVLTKAHAVTLPTGSRDLQLRCILAMHCLLKKMSPLHFSTLIFHFFILVDGIRLTDVDSKLMVFHPVVCTYNGIFYWTVVFSCIIKTLHRIVV